MANQHPERRDGFLKPGNVVVVPRPPSKDGSDRMMTKDGIKADSTVGRAKDVNFSLFLRPALLKGTKPRCDLGCGSGSVRKTVAAAKETGAGHQTCSPPEQKTDCGFPKGDKPSGNPGPDKRFSELASNMEDKRTARGAKPTCDPQVPAMSLCSHGASNDPKVSPKRRYEDCESLSQSDSDSEDSRRFDRAAGTKERRGSAHRSSERSRRQRINKKLRALQELLPNCDKVDQAGVLDEAIEYLKTLQQQFMFQVLSTGTPMYMSPAMMLPAGIQQMYAPTPYPGQFSTFNVPRGMSVGAGLQFPIPPGTRTAALGLQQPVLPFVPTFGRSSGSMSSAQASDLSRPIDSVDDLLDSGDLSGSSGDDQS